MGILLFLSQNDKHIKSQTIKTASFPEPQFLLEDTWYMREQENHGTLILFKPNIEWIAMEPSCP